MIKVGVFFGGASREREVSFAGGRTVYDNLDKTLFDAVPIFVDAYGHFVELEWEYVYRGTIRDFFPPAKFLPVSEYQIYSDSLSLSEEEYLAMLDSIGRRLTIEDIAKEIDFAFLALHGSYGEDGTLQGMLEWYRIPYSGSGILASSLGVSKHVQKKWWSSNLDINPWKGLSLESWKLSDKSALLRDLEQKLGFPFVVKSSNQGSSIGVKVVKDNDVLAFEESVNAAFFINHIYRTDWDRMDKYAFVQGLTDLRTGLGLPLLCNGVLVKHPDQLEELLKKWFESEEVAELQAVNGEFEVIFEQFIEGREFSCIVVVDDQGNPFALPPTEVVKGKDIFDYNSKYLPGLSHKQTPIQIEDNKVMEIRTKCVELFKYFGFEVYARIDGFINEKGIFLNDPNTTSGMMPSSFFFHQAAEIGLNPKSFITYIVRTSLAERVRKHPSRTEWIELLAQLDRALDGRDGNVLHKRKVAVILGGYSTERHISVESGRNIYEKLASSKEYDPVPVFLSGKDGAHRLFKIPVNIMLKDNADDIRSKIDHPVRSVALDKIRTEAIALSERYADHFNGYEIEEIDYDQLASEFSLVFIALHGRPGEDGQIQKELSKRGIPFNGSGVKSSELTINKFETNKRLKEAGFLVAEGHLIKKDNWLNDHEAVITLAESMHYPLIAKPHDEGCSSAVIKINDISQLRDYADLCFGLRKRDKELEESLKLGPKDEFPLKDCFLLETFTSRAGADHFLEITGGMLTKWVDGQIEFEVFEPSEALSTGSVLTLAEKFLAGEGQNITPARFSADPVKQAEISTEVRRILGQVARTVGVEGYCRIDAFVRIYKDRPLEVIIIEINSLPGMTPATCIYHQAAINHYKPFEFIDKILEFGDQRTTKNI